MFLIGFLPSVAQSALDAYKYIIVPKKFDFLSEENQYRVNSTTKYLFEQNGFVTLIQGENYPDDLMKNPCLAATAHILDESNLFTTKLYVQLFDCRDREVFRSEMGKSNEKAWDKTYIYALNNAFVSFEDMEYNYDPSLAGDQADKAITASAAAATASPATTSPSQVTPEVSKEPVAAVSVPVAAAVVATDDKEEPEVEEPVQVQEEPTPVQEEPTLVQEEPKQHEPAPVQEESEVSVASSYGNESVSFLLIPQGDKLVAYVSDSKNSEFKNGEVIGTLVRTSLTNVFRASWKNMDKDIDQTTAYFDEKGNLRIDVDRNGKIEVLTFVKQ